MEFIVTGKFKYIAQSFANGVVTEREEIGAISEIVRASSVESAQEIAGRMFARYEAKYGEVTDRRVVESKPFPSKAAVEEQAEEQAAEKPAAMNHGQAIRCRKCGVSGLVGRGYPFSTLPASACLCDDCGA